MWTGCRRGASRARRAPPGLAAGPPPRGGHRVRFRASHASVGLDPRHSSVARNVRLWTDGALHGVAVWGRLARRRSWRVVAVTARSRRSRPPGPICSCTPSQWISIWDHQSPTMPILTRLSRNRQRSGCCPGVGRCGGGTAVHHHARWPADPQADVVEAQTCPSMRRSRRRGIR